MLALPNYVDDARFRGLVEAIVTALVEQESPAGLVVVTVRDWFGAKWVPYEAGSRGDEGLYGRRVGAPRFVPNRVLQQDEYAYPSLERVGSGPTLHRLQMSADADSVIPFEMAPDHVFVWVSSGSAGSGRGALLCLVPRPEGCWAWYAGFHAYPEWHVAEVLGITRDETERLLRIGESSVGLVD
jgi:hypothetical protein